MMHFLNPYFLIGVLAALVPLLIFLMTHDTVARVPFSTLRFFAGTATLVKRKWWQEFLLIAMRMTACVLLALAFARPFLNKPDTDKDGRMKAAKAVALVVDVSASMSQPGVWEQARAGIQQALVGGAPRSAGDAVATLLVFDRAPRIEVPWTRDLAQLLKQSAALQPGAGGTDLAAAIHEADEALEQVSAPDKEIIVVSDCAAHGWAGFQGDWKLHAGRTLTIQAITGATGVSPAIVAADYPQSMVNDGLPRAVTVRIANFSESPIQGLPVRLTVNDKEIETQKVNLAAGAQVVARFQLKFDQIGDNRGLVSIGEVSAKAQPLGSVLYFNSRVIPKVAVLILDGAAAATERGAPSTATEGGATAGQAFFLQTALAPSQESPFVVKVAPAAGGTGVPPVTSKTANDIDQAAVVMLSDVNAVSGEVRTALSNVLKRGGGLLFLPGAHASPESFAANFESLAPCKLRRVMLAGEIRPAGAKAVLTKINLEHPVFEIFQRPHFGDFTAVAFDRYWEVADSQLCAVLARFDDGRPFLLEKPLANGSSMLLASPLDPHWNNLADRAIFLPFLHQVTRYLARRTERPTAHAVGDILAIPPQSSLKCPSGQTVQAGSFVATESGYYTVLDSKGTPSFTYAVNSEFAEANPAAVDTAELRAALMPAGGASSETKTSDSRTFGDAGKEIWSYLIAALLVLTIAELFVANRVARH